MNKSIKKLDVTKLSTSQLAKALLKFKGKPLSLEGYAPFKAIYDIDAPMMTMRCSRQVGKLIMPLSI